LLLKHQFFWVAAVAPVHALSKKYETEAEIGKKFENKSSSIK